MAKNTYYVVFENNTDGATAQKPVASNKKSDNQDEKNMQALTKGVKGYASLTYAERVADKVFTHAINTVELRTGHVELQQQMQFAYGVGKQAFDTVKNMVMAGSVFGGAGVLIGGVVGVADWGISTALRQSEINMRREVENTSLFFARIRAGAGQDRTGNTR